MGGIDFDGRGNYVRTFYPSTTNEIQASPIEIAPGSESTGIDINLAKSVIAYMVTGRTIIADTGLPYIVSDARRFEIEVFEGPPFSDKYSGRFLFGRPDNKGKFEVVGGLVPGKYAAAVKIESDDRDFYGELMPFEVTDHDVTGLELKVRRSSTVSGLVSAGSQDRGLSPEVFQRLRILAHTLQDADGAPLPDSLSRAESASDVGADGSFLIRGLRPGKIKLGLEGFSNPGWWIVRIEAPGSSPSDRDTSVPAGYQYPQTFDVPAGADLSALRVVVAVGSATIQGRVRVSGGELPGGLIVNILYHKVDALSPQRYRAYVGSDGQFKIDNLLAGTYVVETSLEPRGQSPATVPANIHHSVTTVTVADGEKSEVTLSIELK
jgi:hypothetical protein